MKVIVYLLKRRNYLDHNTYLVLLHPPFPKDLFHLICSQQSMYVKLEISLLDKKHQKEETWFTDYIVPAKPTAKRFNRRALFLLVSLASGPFVKAGQIEIKHLLLIKILYLSENQSKWKGKSSILFQVAASSDQDTLPHTVISKKIRSSPSVLGRPCV